MEETVKTEKKLTRPNYFQKGNDPRRNLNGRPAGTKNFTTKVKEALETIAEGKNYTYEEAFIKAILHKAIVQKDPTIMKLIWEQFDGKPLQKVEQDSTIKLESDIPEDINERLNQINDELSKLSKENTAD